MLIRCKCHGMSGSCQLKTCWKAAPEFHTVGKALKQLFRRAVLVDQSNMGNGAMLIVANNKKNRRVNQNRIGKGAGGKSRGRGGGGARHPRRASSAVSFNNKMVNQKKLENSLFYYQRSPNFCEKDSSSDIQGSCINLNLLF